MIDIKNENKNYAVEYLNPHQSEHEISSHLIYEDESKEINYSNTHSSEFKEEKKWSYVQMPVIEKKCKRQRKSNDPNK